MILPTARRIPVTYTTNVRNHARLLFLVLLVAAATAIWVSPVRSHLTPAEIHGFVASVRAAWYAPLLLIAMYAIGCVFAIPASLFIVAAGAIWGTLLGGTFALAGGILGAAASFFAARFLGAALPEKQGRTREMLDRHLRHATFRSLLIVRLLPIFPFAVLNYGAGLMRVNPALFLTTTFLGLIPSNYVFAWSADEIYNGTLSGGAVWTRLITVAAICVAAVVLPSIVAKGMKRT